MLYLVLGVLIGVLIFLIVIFYNLVKRTKEREEYDRIVYVEEFLMQEREEYKKEREYKND